MAANKSAVEQYICIIRNAQLGFYFFLTNEQQQQLIKLVKANKQLTRFSLFGVYNLPAKTVNRLLSAVAANDTITHLDLCEPFDARGAKLLGRILKNNKNLKSLVIYNRSVIVTSEFKAVIELVKTSKYLQSVRLNGSSSKEADAYFLREISQSKLLNVANLYQLTLFSTLSDSFLSDSLVMKIDRTLLENLYLRVAKSLKQHKVIQNKAEDVATILKPLITELVEDVRCLPEKTIMEVVEKAFQLMNLDNVICNKFGPHSGNHDAVFSTAGQIIEQNLTRNAILRLSHIFTTPASVEHAVPAAAAPAAATKLKSP